MEKIRGLLMVFVLLAILGGLILSETGSMLSANVPSSLHTTISSPAGTLTGAESSQLKLAVICAGGGADDC